MCAGIHGPDEDGVFAGGRGTSGRGVLTLGRRDVDEVLGVCASGERACWCWGVDGKPPGRGRGVPFIVPCGSWSRGWLLSWDGPGAGQVGRGAGEEAGVDVGGCGCGCGCCCCVRRCCRFCRQTKLGRVVGARGHGPATQPITALRPRLSLPSLSSLHSSLARHSSLWTLHPSPFTHCTILFTLHPRLCGSPCYCTPRTSRPSAHNSPARLQHALPPSFSSTSHKLPSDLSSLQTICLLSAHPKLSNLYFLHHDFHLIVQETSSSMASEKVSTTSGTVDDQVKVDTSSSEKPETNHDHVALPANDITSELPTESQEAVSAAPATAAKSPEDGEAREMSPSSKKRFLAELPEEPLGKKSKMGEEESLEPSIRFPSPPDVPATSVDKETWQGYCEIESDPAYFSVILREIGIQGVDVQELLMVDTEQLSLLPPVYGLVLLFRHRQFDQHKQKGTCPDNVWFANQMPAQNSCATLAMIHTLLNVNDPDIDIGEHMHQFKDFTKDMTPLQRGHTFASWKFVKGIHNSFAKKMDMLENDKYIAAKVAKAEKDKAAAQKNSAETKKAPSVQTKSCSRTARRNSDDSNASNDSVEAFEGNAHHYITFVPVEGQVWKLDGMDKQPTLMGEYDEEQGETWIDAVSERINTLIQAGDDDYGIFAITQSPIVPLRNQLCEADNTIKRVDIRLDALSTDWKDFLDEEYREPPSPSFMGSFSEEQRAANPIPGSIKAAIDKEDVPELLVRHRKLVAEMQRLVLDFMQQMQVVSEQDERAEARRWDYGPAIQAWVAMLAENGFLADHIDDFRE